MLDGDLIFHIHSDEASFPRRRFLADRHIWRWVVKHRYRAANRDDGLLPAFYTNGANIVCIPVICPKTATIRYTPTGHFSTTTATVAGTSAIDFYPANKLT